MKYIYEIEQQGLLWVNITKQEEKTLLSLQKRFSFDKQEIQESLPPLQRPKLVKRDGYYFIVLHFPVFDRKTRRLGFTEVDFFLNGSSLVSIHDDSLPIIGHFFNQCQKDSAVRDKYFQGTAAQLFLEVLNRLLDSIFPILLHVNEDINAINKILFTKIPDRKMAEEILRLKTNVVTFRRTMQGHKTVLDRLVSGAGRELSLQSYQNYINLAHQHLNEIWQTLETQKESVDALHETNESVVGLRMNEIMKTLTVISVITFPLTLVATIFSIGAVDTPFVHQPFGFWIVSFLVLIGALAMLAVFKAKKWLD
ncbi:MAG TPA: magnesium transporter CorA family protein [Candidatus Udaeobacter sp.]|nr:magnesium transporter CorA family protein [Candidatus Udaeobacter sp.]